MNAKKQKIQVNKLRGDVKMLKDDPHELFDAVQSDEDPLVWYFLIKGCDEYEGGYYLGKIIHNPEYPFKPPNYEVLTPSGRFTINTKICTSNTQFHANEWKSSWNIQTIVLGFVSIMLDNRERGISHIVRGPEERHKYALESHEYNLTHHYEIYKLFKEFLSRNNIDIGEK